MYIKFSLFSLTPQVPTPRDFASFQRTPKLMSRVVLTRERIRAVNFNLTHLTDLAPESSPQPSKPDMKSTLYEKGSTWQITIDIFLKKEK